jgi:hypothetical protein
MVYNKGVFAILLFILISAVSLNCSVFKKGGGAIDSHYNGRPSIDDRTYHSLELQLLTKPMGYALGGPVDMKMRLTNNSDRDIRLDFPDDRAFDFFIYQKDELVYRYSEDDDYPTGLEQIILEPGRHIDLGGLWLTKDRNGVYVRGGRYHMIGVINTRPLIISNMIMFGLTD